MKPTQFLTILMALFLASCGSGNVDKTSKLAELQAKRDQLNAEIEVLQKEISAENPQTPVIKTKNVAVQVVQPRVFDFYVRTQGLVEAENNISVSARTMGVITSVYVQEGQEVAKGQTLAQIDHSLIATGVDEVVSALELATTMYDRQKKLWDQKIGTEIQYLQAKNNKESLEARLASLNEQLDMTKIKSPISGTVDEVSIKIGQNVAPGMPTFRVINAKELKVKAQISEAYSTLVKKGNKVKIILEPNEELVSTVSFAGRNIDPLSRTFPVEMMLPPSANVRPNMTAVVKVIFQSEPAALCVPVNVVQEVNGEKIIYVAEPAGENTVARKRIVEIGGVFDDLAEVKANLKAGEQVIIFGYQGLNDGEYVKI